MFLVRVTVVTVKQQIILISQNILEHAFNAVIHNNVNANQTSIDTRYTIT